MSQTRGNRSEIFPRVTGFSGRNEVIWGAEGGITVHCKLIISPFAYQGLNRPLHTLSQLSPGNPQEQRAIKGVLEYLIDTGLMFYWSEGTGGYVDVDNFHISIVPGSNKRGDYYVQLIAEGIPTQVHINDICPWSSDPYVGTVEEAR